MKEKKVSRSRRRARKECLAQAYWLRARQMDINIYPAGKRQQVLEVCLAPIGRNAHQGIKRAVIAMIKATPEYVKKQVVHYTAVARASGISVNVHKEELS